MDQKIPKPKRLQEWYRKMLDKAVAERIVHDYKVPPVLTFRRDTHSVVLRHPVISQSPDGCASQQS